MTEEMKRLVEVLNEAGYKVMSFIDRQCEIDDDGSCNPSGMFELTVKVVDTTIYRSKSRWPA